MSVAGFASDELSALALDRDGAARRRDPVFDAGAFDRDFVPASEASSLAGLDVDVFFDAPFAVVRRLGVSVLDSLDVDARLRAGALAEDFALAGALVLVGALVFAGALADDCSAGLRPGAARRRDEDFADPALLSASSVTLDCDCVVSDLEAVDLARRFGASDFVSSTALASSALAFVLLERLGALRRRDDDAALDFDDVAVS